MIIIISIINALPAVTNVLVWTFISVFVLKHFVRTFIWTLGVQVALTRGRRPVLLRTLLWTPVNMVALPVLYGVAVTLRFLSGR